MSQTTNLINLDVNAVTLAKPHAELLEQDAVPKSYITAQISSLIGGASESLDTLSEIASAIQENDGAIETISSLISEEIEDRTDAISAETSSRVAQISSQTSTLSVSIQSTLTTETANVNADIASATAVLQTGITTLHNEQSAIVTSISTEAAARSDVVVVLSQEITDEVSARNVAIASASTTLSNEVQTINSSISAETNERVADVLSLVTAIDEETTERVDAVSSLTTAITSEKNERVDAVSELSAAIYGEASDRVDAVLSLTDAIGEETANRGLAVLSLNNAISSETTARGDAISSEVASRIEQVGQLSGTINTEFSGLDDQTDDISVSLSTQLASLSTTIVTETGNREADVLSLTTAIGGENNERVAAVASLTTSINDAVVSHTTLISSARAAKLDRSNKYSKRYDSNFAVAENEAYLYIGEGWRIAASNSNNRKKLTFEYSVDGLDWKLGLPFIKDIVTPSSLSDIFAQQSPQHHPQGVFDVNMHMLAPTPTEELRTKIPHAYKLLESSPDSTLMSLTTYESQPCTFTMSIQGYNTNFENTNEPGCNTTINASTVTSWPAQWRSHNDPSVPVAASGTIFQLRNISITSEKTFSGILVFNDGPVLTDKFLGFALENESQEHYLTVGSSTTASRVYFNIL